MLPILVIVVLVVVAATVAFFVIRAKKGGEDPNGLMVDSGERLADFDAKSAEADASVAARVPGSLGDRLDASARAGQTAADDAAAEEASQADEREKVDAEARAKVDADAKVRADARDQADAEQQASAKAAEAEAEAEAAERAAAKAETDRSAQDHRASVDTAGATALDHGDDEVEDEPFDLSRFGGSSAKKPKVEIPWPTSTPVVSSVRHMEASPESAETAPVIDLTEDADAEPTNADASADGATDEQAADSAELSSSVEHQADADAHVGGHDDETVVATVDTPGEAHVAEEPVDADAVADSESAIAGVTFGAGADEMGSESQVADATVGESDDGALVADAAIPSQPVPEPEDNSVDLVVSALIQRAKDRKVGVAQVAAEMVEQADLEDREVDEVLMDLVSRDDSDVHSSDRLSELRLFNDDVPTRPGQLTQFSELRGTEKKRVIVRVLCLLVALAEDNQMEPKEPRSEAEKRSWPLARAVWPVAGDVSDDEDDDDLPARRYVATRP